MCQDILVLAQHSEHRSIQRCEHATVHLVWDNATLHLWPQDFLRLASWVESIQNTGTIAATGMAFHLDGSGNADLWVGSVGLRLAAADLLVLRQLAAEAATMMKQPQKPTSGWYLYSGEQTSQLN